MPSSYLGQRGSYIQPDYDPQDELGVAINAALALTKFAVSPLIAPTYGLMAIGSAGLAGAGLIGASKSVFSKSGGVNKYARKLYRQARFGFNTTTPGKFSQFMNSMKGSIGRESLMSGARGKTKAYGAVINRKAGSVASATISSMQFHPFAAGAGFAALGAGIAAQDELKRGNPSPQKVSGYMARGAANRNRSRH